MGAPAEKMQMFNLVEGLDHLYQEKRAELEQVAQAAEGISVVKLMVAEHPVVVEVGLAVETLAYRAPQSLPRANPWVLGLIEVRGEVMPAIDFAAYNNQGKTDCNKSARYVIVRHEQAAYALLVSSVSAVMQVDQINEQVNNDIKIPDGFEVELNHWVDVEGEQLSYLNLETLVDQSEFLNLTF